MTTPNINKLLLARPWPCRYGAPLGARNRYDAAPGARIYSQRVRFVDGRYAPDGTYWGAPADVYAVFSADLETLAYYQARDYRDALAQFANDPAAPIRTAAPVGRILSRYGSTLRIYDNAGRTFDRYTVLPPRWAKKYREHGRTFLAIGASTKPFDPQGFGQTTVAVPGPHLGRRIEWGALPADVQQFARQMFPEYAPAKSTINGASNNAE